MQDLALLGNAAAVPVVVAITQFLKRNFTFKRRSDVISLVVAFLVCGVWDFYTTPSAELVLLWGSGVIGIGKYFVDLLIVSFATWLSASKSYDLFVGEKKRAKVLDQHIKEKEELFKVKQTLEKQVEDLRNGNGTEEKPADENPAVSDKLREILEG